MAEKKKTLTDAASSVFNTLTKGGGSGDNKIEEEKRLAEQRARAKAEKEAHEKSKSTNQAEGLPAEAGSNRAMNEARPEYQDVKNKMEERMAMDEIAEEKKKKKGGYAATILGVRG